VADARAERGRLEAEARALRDAAAAAPRPAAGAGPREGPAATPGGPQGGAAASADALLGASLRDGSLLTALARLASPRRGRAASGSQVPASPSLEVLASAGCFDAGRACVLRRAEALLRLPTRRALSLNSLVSGRP
jgi:hypothetical protein